MAVNPGRISEIHIESDFGNNNITTEELSHFERLALARLVANSLGKEIRIVTNFS